MVTEKSHDIIKRSGLLEWNGSGKKPRWCLLTKIKNGCLYNEVQMHKASTGLDVNVVGTLHITIRFSMAFRVSQSIQWSKALQKLKGCDLIVE
jgi:hypothetical protein